jgi:hypothetical protein
MDSITQTHTDTPDKDILQDRWTPMTPRRATRFTSFVLGLVFGTGVVILTALLSAWLCPSTRAIATPVMSAEQSQVRPLSPGEMEELGMSPALLENPFAHL